MIFGWMSRDFYLKNTIRALAVETPPSSSRIRAVGRRGIKNRA